MMFHAIKDDDAIIPINYDLSLTYWRKVCVGSGSKAGAGGSGQGEWAAAVLLFDCFKI